MKYFLRALALSSSFWLASTAGAAEILNASYDVARELFEAVNPAFVKEWKAKTGETLTIRQSHGGSSKQARAVADGLPADVVTFNQVTDIEFLEKLKLISSDWSKRLPNHATPY
jgi:sulfate transport system substrate-binding protein